MSTGFSEVTISLETPVQNLNGVGLKRVKMFAYAGIFTVEDLLKNVPFRYKNRINSCPINEVNPVRKVVMQGQIVATIQHTPPRNGMWVVHVTVSYDPGDIQAIFFHQPYLNKVFQNELTVIFYGIPRRDRSNSEITMINSELEVLEDGAESHLHSGCIVPVYRKIEMMSTLVLRQMTSKLLSQLPLQLKDPLPSSILNKYKFQTLRSDFQEIHFPNSIPEITIQTQLCDLDSRQTPSHQIFFLVQLKLQVKLGNENNIR